jgi:hypothetical protein
MTPEIDFFFDDIANTEGVINPDGKMMKMTVVGNITVEEGLIDFPVAAARVGYWSSPTGGDPKNYYYFRLTGNALMVCRGPEGFAINSLTPFLLPVIAPCEFLPRGMIDILQDEETDKGINSQSIDLFDQMIAAVTAPEASEEQGE